MRELNLPAFNAKLKKEDTGRYIFDPVRKKYVFLTPEEWVRQHFLNLMIEHLHYPRSLMRVESGIHYHQSQKRTDIQVMDRDSGIFLMVECKAPEVAIDAKVLNQLAVYNKVVQATFIALTNGLKHFIWESTATGYEQRSHFPSYPD